MSFVDPPIAVTSGEIVSPISLPSGTPSWITPELVALTLKVWQPQYVNPLSIGDAIAMIAGAGRLCRVLWTGGTHDPDKPVD